MRSAKWGRNLAPVPGDRNSRRNRSSRDAVPRFVGQKAVRVLEPTFGPKVEPFFRRWRVRWSWHWLSFVPSCIALRIIIFYFCLAQAFQPLVSSPHHNHLNITLLIAVSQKLPISQSLRSPLSTRHSTHNSNTAYPCNCSQIVIVALKVVILPRCPRYTFRSARHHHAHRRHRRASDIILVVVTSIRMLMHVLISIIMHLQSILI